MRWILVATVAMGCTRSSVSHSTVEDLAEGKSDELIIAMNEFGTLNAVVASHAAVENTRKLSFLDTDFSGPGWACIAKLKNVSEVLAYSTQNTRLLLANSKFLNQLESIQLAETDLTDAGLGAIKAPGPKRLSIHGVTPFSAESIDKCRERLKNCQLEFTVDPGEKKTPTNLQK